MNNRGGKEGAMLGGKSQAPGVYLGAINSLKSLLLKDG